MRKIFWENPYQCSLATTVAAVENNEVLFNETIAYSFSGGQESDKATVNGIPILNSKILGTEIYYTLPDQHALAVGDPVTMEIDWTRRNRLMRLHFACELILVIINRLFGHMPATVELKPEDIDHLGIVKSGAHIAEDKARIDFRIDHNISTHFSDILSEYNRIINADLPIETGYINEIEQIRYWRIASFAMIPCGGTHVKSTAEVGLVKLKRDNVGNGVERIKITLENPSPTS